jgi:WD40 repeat protein
MRVNPKNHRCFYLRRKLVTPAVGFLIFTIILSTTIFILSMRSGVPKFSLPTLVEITSANVNLLKPIYLLEKGVGITSVIFSPDGQYLAVARLDKILHVWSTKDYQLIYTFHIEPDCVECVAFSPDSRFLASVRETRPYDVIVWDIATGKSPWESFGTLANPDEKISSLVFSPDGKLLAESIGNRVLFWQVDIKGFELIREIVGNSGPVNSLAFSSDGLRLLTTSDDMTAKVWDANTGDWLMTLSGHTDIVANGIFFADPALIVTAGYDRTIRFWDSQTGLLVKILEEHTSPVISLTSSLNGQILASGGMDERVILWDVKTWNKLFTVTENHKDIIPMAFSPDNKIFITTGPDDKLWLWGVEK